MKSASLKASCVLSAMLCITSHSTIAQTPLEGETRFIRNGIVSASVAQLRDVDGIMPLSADSVIAWQGYRSGAIYRITFDWRQQRITKIDEIFSAGVHIDILSVGGADSQNPWIHLLNHNTNTYTYQLGYNSTPQNSLVLDFQPFSTLTHVAPSLDGKSAIIFVPALLSYVRMGTPINTPFAIEPEFSVYPHSIMANAKMDVMATITNAQRDGKDTSIVAAHRIPPIDTAKALWRHEFPSYRGRGGRSIDLNHLPAIFTPTDPIRVDGSIKSIAGNRYYRMFNIETGAIEFELVFQEDYFHSYFDESTQTHLLAGPGRLLVARADGQTMFSLPAMLPRSLFYDPANGIAWIGGNSGEVVGVNLVQAAPEVDQHLTDPLP